MPCLRDCYVANTGRAKIELNYIFLFISSLYLQYLEWTFKDILPDNNLIIPLIWRLNRLIYNVITSCSPLTVKGLPSNLEVIDECGRSQMNLKETDCKNMNSNRHVTWTSRISCRYKILPTVFTKRAQFQSSRETISFLKALLLRVWQQNKKNFPLSKSSLQCHIWTSNFSWEQKTYNNPTPMSAFTTIYFLFEQPRAWPGIITSLKYDKVVLQARDCDILVCSNCEMESSTSVPMKLKEKSVNSQDTARNEL